jgi:hypothetical protein
MVVVVVVVVVMVVVAQDPSVASPAATPRA